MTNKIFPGAIIKLKKSLGFTRVHVPNVEWSGAAPVFDVSEVGLVVSIHTPPWAEGERSPEKNSYAYVVTSAGVHGWIWADNLEAVR